MSYSIYDGIHLIVDFLPYDCTQPHGTGGVEHVVREESEGGITLITNTNINYTTRQQCSSLEGGRERGRERRKEREWYNFITNRYIYILERYYVVTYELISTTLSIVNRLISPFPSKNLANR